MQNDDRPLLNRQAEDLAYLFRCYYVLDYPDQLELEAAFNALINGGCKSIEVIASAAMDILTAAGLQKLEQLPKASSLVESLKMWAEDKNIFAHFKWTPALFQSGE